MGDGLDALRERLGQEYVERRLRAQVHRAEHRANSGRGGFHLENIPLFFDLVALSLRATGLYGHGQRNALAIDVREHILPIPGLPPALAGLRLLYISDLHLDGHPDLTGRLLRALAGLSFDICVLGGDYRFHETGGYYHLSPHMADLMPALACRHGVYGILGNHDFIEMVPLMEELGVRMLVNEAAEVRVEGGSLWLVGLDDPHFYGMYDFDRAAHGVPWNAPRLLLAHSPEVAAEASARGYNAYLTGHTHGGQIRLPGGVAPYFNARCSRRFMAGGWQYAQMAGYTSFGAGATGVFVRYFCPPEILIVVLAAPN